MHQVHLEKSQEKSPLILVDLTNTLDLLKSEPLLSDCQKDQQFFEFFLLEQLAAEKVQNVVY